MDRNAWIAAIGSFAFSALTQAAPFAMITDVKGDAWALEGGKPRTHGLTAVLQRDDAP